MKAVRRALREIAALELDLWSEDDAPLVAVDRSGGIVIQHNGEAQRPGGQSILGAGMLDLLAPFTSREGLRGPDLSAPRPHLRIVPGKSGLEQAKIYQLYPDIERAAIEDALDLERQLAQNLHPALAA